MNNIHTKKLGLFLATAFFSSWAFASTNTVSAPKCAAPMLENSGLEFTFYAGASQNTTSNTSGVTYSPYETDTLTNANKNSNSFVPGFGIAYNYVVPGDYFYVHNVSLGVNYYHTGLSRDGQVYLYGYPRFNNYTYDMSVSSNRLMLDGEVDVHPLWKGLTFFGEAGAGGSLNNVGYNEKSVLNNGGALNLDGNTNLSFAYEFGGGVKMPVTRKSDLSLRYLYANLGKAESSTQAQGMTGNPSESISTDVISQSILLGYTYHVN